MRERKLDIDDIIANINVRAQIAFALMLIVGLLIYIAFFR